MAFSTQALTFLLSSFAGFQAAKKVELTDNFVVLLETIRVLPFLLNPLYGFLSDVFPLFGYRFKSFIIGCLLIQLVVCLCIFYLDNLNLDTLLSLGFVLNITSAFISCLLQGIVTIVTKIDSKIHYPEFVEDKKRSVLYSKSNRLIGVYQFLFLCGNYLSSYFSYLASSNDIISQEYLYLIYGALTFVFGVIIIFFFKERKVNFFSIFLIFLG